MAEHRLKKHKKSKKKGEDAGGHDVRLHKAEDAHALKKLLHKVDDHDALDMNGDTPLHSYVRRRDKEKFNCLMTFLIHSRCDVNMANREGQTALHLACEGSDTRMIKALIAFDAKINGMSNHYTTPLDIALENDPHSEVKDILLNVGAMTAEEMGCCPNEDSFDGGRVSPYTEVDIYSRNLNETQPLCVDFNHARPPSLAALTNGHGGRDRDKVDYQESPSASTRHQRREESPLAPPPPEEDEDDLVFMTAHWQPEDLVFMTARQDLLKDAAKEASVEGNTPEHKELGVEEGEKDTTKVYPPEDASDERSRPRAISSGPFVSPVRDHTSPISPESSVQMTLTSSISPSASLEMALTPLSVMTLNGQLQNLLDSKEDSISSISSLSSILDRNPFLSDYKQSVMSTGPPSLPLVHTPHEDSHLDRGKQMEAAYEQIYSHKGFPAINGALPVETTDTDSISECSPAYSPVAQSPQTHSPMTRSPAAHSPTTCSPKESPRNSRKSSPTPSPRKLSVVEEEEGTDGDMVKLQKTTHLTPVSQSPLAKAESPIAPSPVTASPITPSPLTRSPIAPSPLAQSPTKTLPHLVKTENSPNKPDSQEEDRDDSNDHNHHVHFAERPAKGSDNLPVRYQKHGGTKDWRRRIHLQRQPSSDGPTRSLSTVNSNMDVLTSIIGYSVVHHNKGRLGGQKVLCLDGGGVKGLIQIEMLRTIEQMTGQSIVDLFDWVVGTSTGGILALGMIYGGLSLSELRQLYFEMKDTVFKQQSKFISHTCDTQALEDLLKRMLGTEQKMDRIKKPNVLITAVEKTTNRLPLVYFNNCFENIEKKSVRNELVWKVARYTSAAPVFFAECDNYVDGGVVANNPTIYAIPEIQDFLTKKHGRGSPEARISCVVSLGCGVYPPEPLGNTDIVDALKWTKIHRAPQRLGDLLTLLTTALGGSEETSRLCRINCEHQGISYFRFSPEIGEDVGTTEKDSRKLCEIILKAKELFVENAEQVKEMVKVLDCELQEDYLYRI